MRECLVVAFEDVLIGTDEVAYPRFLTMYRTMAAEYRTVLLTTLDREHAQRVAALNHVRYDLLMDKANSALTDESWKVTSVREVMGMGWPIGFYWDVDPDVIRQAFAMGVTTLLMSHKVLRPSWLPSQAAPRAWNELVTFVDEQREHDASDRGSGGVFVVGGGRGIRGTDVPDAH